MSSPYSTDLPGKHENTARWMRNRINAMASVTRYTVPSYLFTVEEDVI